MLPLRAAARKVYSSSASWNGFARFLYLKKALENTSRAFFALYGLWAYSSTNSIMIGLWSVDLKPESSTAQRCTEILSDTMNASSVTS